jgi:hypothetical protein
MIPQQIAVFALAIACEFQCSTSREFHNFPSWPAHLRIGYACTFSNADHLSKLGGPQMVGAGDRFLLYIITNDSLQSIVLSIDLEH